MIYFTSDLHLYDEEIIKYKDRPFDMAEDMNWELIKNWNNVVAPTDEVYVLGDLTIRGGAAASGYLKAFNGTKYLIKGNHDKYIEDAAFDTALYRWIKEYYEFNYNDDKFILFHYPILEWNSMRRGTINLHGHIHSDRSYNIEMQKKEVKRYDVGVDANGYKPVSIDEIIRTVE